jgi:hypothetical protein
MTGKAFRLTIIALFFITAACGREATLTPAPPTAIPTASATLAYPYPFSQPIIPPLPTPYPEPSEAPPRETPLPPPDFYPRFSLLSIAFTDINQGWALGLYYSAADRVSVAMRATNDGGLTWSELPPPAIEMTTD